MYLQLELVSPHCPGTWSVLIPPFLSFIITSPPLCPCTLWWFVPPGSWLCCGTHSGLLDCPGAPPYPHLCGSFLAAHPTREASSVSPKGRKGDEKLMFCAAMGSPVSLKAWGSGKLVKHVGLKIILCAQKEIILANWYLIFFFSWGFT